MIESNIIKRFIVRTFMQNSELPIPKISEVIMNALSNRFLLNESVFIPSRNIAGKICKCSKTNYRIVTPDSMEVEAPFGEMVRRFKVDFNDVCYFLECITAVTPLGRIVIENVFDKINQPGFGARRVYTNQPSFDRFSRRHEQVQAPESDGSIGNPFQEVEIRNPIKERKSTESKNEPHAPRLDIKTLKPYDIAGIEAERIRDTIRIYMFFDTFSDNLENTKFKMGELVEALKSPEYSSKIVYEIHSILITLIEKDIKVYGPRFLNDLHLLVKALPGIQLESVPQQAKKRVSFDMENWKSQVKVFIQNLSKDMDNDKPLMFLEFTKRDNFDLKIELICFLLDIVSYTESIKDFVGLHQSQIRLEKSKVDQVQLLKRRTDNESKADLESIRADLNSISLKNIGNPLKAHIGKYREFVLLLVDGSVILKDKLDFYFIGRDQAHMILKDLNIHNKIEKSTITNLKGISEVLFKSQ